MVCICFSVLECATNWLPGTYWGAALNEEDAIYRARQYTKAVRDA
jgi:hypothetical protein